MFRSPLVRLKGDVQERMKYHHALAIKFLIPQGEKKMGAMIRISAKDKATSIILKFMLGSEAPG